MKISILLISSLLVFSISQGTANNIFTYEDNFKIISVSKTECLGKKIQFTVEFEDENLIVPSLEFKLNLQSKYNFDTFFANCSFAPENSQKVPDKVNNENNNEKNKFNSAKKRKAICTYDSLYKQGNYILKTNPENSNVIIEKEIELELIPCDLRNLRLSFRQVNSFKYAKESKSLSFFFFGLSSESINAEETIFFWILLYIGGQKESEPVEAKCSLLGNSSIENNQGDLAIKPVVFSCSYTFNGEEELEEPYIKLYRSEYLTGFPTDSELLYPFLVDLFIKNGSLPNFSEPFVSEIVPAIIKEPKYDFGNFSEKGTLEITGEVTGNFEAGTGFNIPLISPRKGHLSCAISSFRNNLINIHCSMEDELDNEHIIFEQIIVKDKKKELFVLPGMKSGKLSTKIMKGIIPNLKSGKQLSNSTFNIYEDTFKCIDDSENKTFYIHGNKEKQYIFVSVSNSNIKMYDKHGPIYSKNYFDWNHPDYDYFYIISKGTGCFQVYYLENKYFRVDKEKSLFTKSFNILNSETVQFKIYNSLDNSYSEDYENKMTIYLYCSENNFVKELKIDDNYQKLEIDTEKGQYYYEIDYTQKKSNYDNSLNINFNLNNKNYIAITLKIELNYISSIAWMCITLGGVVMLVGLFFGIKFILNYCEKMKRRREELNERLIQRARDQENYEEYKKKEKERIKEEKKKAIKKQTQKNIQKTVNQVVQRASLLYDYIQNDYTLINEACLLCAKCDKISSLIETYNEYEDSEGDEDCEENNDYDDYDDYENKHKKNIFNKYDKNKTLNVIEDINKGKYDSFMNYISPKYCQHFYHKSCRNKFSKAFDYFFTGPYSKYCNFCKIFLTIDNMQKFGCFFSKEFFVNYFRDTVNNEFRDYLAKKETIKEMENIFYSAIQKSLIIDEDKQWRIECIKEMNKDYLENFDKLRRFDKNIDYYRFYELSINTDLKKEKEKLDYELEGLDEKIEEIRRKKREREEREREEREWEEREWEEREENRRREKEEREDNRKREKREEKEKRRPVYLLRCCFCGDKCLFCKGKVTGSGRNKGYVKKAIYFRAHGSCIPSDNIKICAVCLKNTGTSRCNNICYNCFEKRNKIEYKCYYCKKELIFWEK